MPLKKMSYKIANKIFDLYTNRLLNVDKLGPYKHYGYSELDGYDVIDISNALKLLAAYRFFNTVTLDSDKKSELKKYASEDSSALGIFSLHFFPDDIASKLKRIDPADEKGMSEYIQLTSNMMNSEMDLLLNKQETPDSFLNYCFHIGRSDSNYWGKVYDRIGISWDTNDDKDPIFVLIKHGVNFQFKGKQIENSATSKEGYRPFDKVINIFKKLKEVFVKS